MTVGSRTWLCKRFPFVLQVVAIGAMGGCSMSRHPAEVEWRHAEAADVSELLWPARVVEHLSEASAGSDFQFTAAAGIDEVAGVERGEGDDRRDLPTVRMVQTLSPRGQGWVRGGAMEFENGPRFTRMAFDFACWNAAGEIPEPPEFTDLVSYDAYIDEVLETADYRQSFYLQLPEGPPKGLVIHAFSMDQHGGPEGRVLSALRERGWAVLRTSQMVSRPFGRDIDLDAAVPGEDDWESALEAQRRLEHSLEQVVASYAYAGEAALDYIHECWPVVKDKPVIVAGFSLGAIMAPTLAARLGDDVAAVVLVGGGADLPSIMSESPMTRWWSSLLGARAGLSESARRQVQEEYRARTNLDPYATAPLLRGRPVLVIHARWDRIVPARYGELLWKRLGHPERWIFSGGHVSLFWNLPPYAAEIAEWAERSALEYWALRRGAGEDASGAMPAEIP